MRLNIADIIYKDGGRIPFEVSFDFSDFEFGGECPVDEPVIAKGQVINKAGALLVEGTVSTTMHPHCDRCCKPMEKHVSIPVQALVADEISNDDNDSIFLMEEGFVDLEEIVATTFVLNQDSKNLCSDDCKGLCPGCGADLNIESCRCKKEVDPRLAALQQLLKDKEDQI